MWTRRRFDLVSLVCIALLARDVHGAPAAVPSPQQDPLAAYRERFKLGMDRYKAGAVADAIGIWEPIYQELGEEKGYRLAYDLGIAFAELKDMSRTAHYLRAFLAELDRRRVRGEVLDAIVLKEEADARARLAAMAVAPVVERASDAGGAPSGAAAEPTAPLPTQIAEGGAAASAPKPSRSPAGSAARVDAAAAPSRVERVETVHPVSAALILGSGGFAIAAGAAAIALEVNANSLRRTLVLEYDNNGFTLTQSDRERFATARTWAYVTLGGAIGLSTVTAGLAAWYFLGSSRREVVTPTVVPEPGGASLGVRTSF